MLELERNEINKILVDNLDANEQTIEFILTNIVNGCHQVVNDVAVKMKVELDWCNENYVTIFNCYFADIKIHMDPNSYIHSTFIIDGLQKYINGDPEGINPAKIALLTPSEMSSNIQKYIDPITNRKVDDVVENLSTRYRCGACQNKKTRIKQVQTKSFDEGTSLLITCVNCNNSWIIN